MGALVTRFRQIFCKAPEMRVLMNGLDAAGKTTILYKLKLGEIVTTIPTIGFNVETVEYRNVNFTVWDVGGRDKIRPLWRHYYQNTSALIWVVDSNDPERLDRDDYGSTRDELHRALAEEELRNAPLLVFSNKQDLPNALQPAEIAERLGLNKLRGRQWLMQGCCATSGDGLYEGLDWLAEAVKKQRAFMATRVESKGAAKPKEAPATQGSSRIVSISSETPASPPPAPAAVPVAPPMMPAVVPNRTPIAATRAAATRPSFSAPRAPVIMDAISSDNPRVFAVKAVESVMPTVVVPEAHNMQLKRAPEPALASVPEARETASPRAYERIPTPPPIGPTVRITTLPPASHLLSSGGRGESEFVLVERLQEHSEQPGAAAEFGDAADGELVWIDSRGEEVARDRRPVALQIIG